MADAVFVANPIAWQHAFRSWQGMTGQFLYTKTVRVAARSSANAPAPGRMPPNSSRTGINFSTGHLQGSIKPFRARWGTELEGRVIALPKHAIFVHNGTRPHVIRPKVPGGSLRFFWHKKGRVVTLPVVRHPGQAANPFMMSALRSEMKTLR